MRRHCHANSNMGVRVRRCWIWVSGRFLGGGPNSEAFASSSADALQAPKRAGWPFPLKQTGVEEMSEKLRSCNDPWSRACEIGVRVHRINPALAYRRQIGPTRVAG